MSNEPIVNFLEWMNEEFAYPISMPAFSPFLSSRFLLIVKSLRIAQLIQMQAKMNLSSLFLLPLITTIMRVRSTPRMNMNTPLKKKKIMKVIDFGRVFF